MTTTVAIPTQPGVPYYVQRTRLDGREFSLRFAFNQREDRWYLDIADDAEVPLVVGIKLIANWPLLRFVQWDPRVPPGNMMVIDLTPNGAPPGFNELGEGLRCELVYTPVTDD